ncbi:DUF5749 family beta-barrel protein [Geoglobus acetivorans]|uniref:Uncharacterized protein n=1 Tax=Geoglobus acetivorans TaxID=565033 RepID=A0ABZ3H7R5_GEOAI|nr:hypothetical protein [Geoglobus acetivorans]
MDLICRFVFMNGKEIGESIDVYGDHLIIKSSDKFFGVPLSAVKEDGDGLALEEFDEEKAKEIGEKWMVEKSKPVSLEELEKYGFGEE